MRNAGLDRLRHRADSSWIHEGRGPRQYLAERQIGKVPHPGWQIAGKLFRENRDQHRAITADAARLHGLAKEVSQCCSSRSWSEEQGWRPRGKEFFDLGS